MARCQSGSVSYTHLFCRFVVATRQPFIVEDAHHDPRTIGDPAIDAFAAVSWIGYAVEDDDGFILGTFCLMDAEPREWSPTDILTVATLARAATSEVALRMACLLYTSTLVVAVE